jgi:hypothetical protein
MNKDRIQINGVWYVKESNAKTTTKKVEIEDYQITKFKGATFENENYCWEATKVYKDDGSFYSGLTIKFTDKTGGDYDSSKTFHWDNDDWMRGVLESDPECLEEARDEMDEEGIAYFQAFLAKLREDFWL